MKFKNWVEKNALAVVMLIVIIILVKATLWPSSGKSMDKAKEWKMVDSGFALVRINLTSIEWVPAIKAKDGNGDIFYKCLYSGDSITFMKARDTLLHKDTIIAKIASDPRGKQLKEFPKEYDVYPEKVPFKFLFDFKSTMK